MRIADPGKSLECIGHEIEISSLLNKATVYLLSTDEMLFKRGWEAKLAVKTLNDFYDHFYQKNNLIKTLTVVEAGDSDYNVFLAISLAIIDPFLIESFLSDHKSRFPQNGNFEGVIEYQVYVVIESVIPIKNADRRERIMKWVNESRKSQPIKQKVIKDVTKEAVLTWHPKYMPVLKKLSKRLWKEKFTKRVGDFEKVFTEGKTINWNKDADHLCYLLYKLRNHTPPLYSASKGKGHYQLIENYFTDDLRKIARKSYIPDTIYKFKTRKPGKPIPERAAIDLMIKYSVG